MEYFAAKDFSFEDAGKNRACCIQVITFIATIVIVVVIVDEKMKTTSMFLMS